MLGALVLGHLTSAETDRVQAHLDGCAACRAELEEITPLAGLLGAVDPASFETPPTPPPGLGDAIRRQVAAERVARDDDELGARRDAARRARGRRTRLVAAAAVLAVVGVGAGLGLGRATAPSPPTVPMEQIRLAAAPGSGVTVDSAGLVNHTWGTELRIVGEGFHAGEVFHAEFRTADGELVPAGEFLGVGAATMTCNLQSAALRDAVTEVVILDEDGSAVASSAL
nr:zf-HC2 domain-containing protein [Nocardioides luti]